MVKVPALAYVCEKVPGVVQRLELQRLLLLIVLWATRVLVLVQRIVSPALIIVDGGEKLVPTMDTSVVAATAGNAAPARKLHEQMSAPKLLV